jgi:hypothetical protein
MDGAQAKSAIDMSRSMPPNEMDCWECLSLNFDGLAGWTGFSKKFENHMHMVALYTVWYNYVKQHKSLKGLSPAMAAGISPTLWSMTDLAERSMRACRRLDRADLTKLRARPFR